MTITNKLAFPFNHLELFCTKLKIGLNVCLSICLFCFVLFWIEHQNNYFTTCLYSNTLQCSKFSNSCLFCIVSYSHIIHFLIVRHAVVNTFQNIFC